MDLEDFRVVPRNEPFEGIATACVVPGPKDRKRSSRLKSGSKALVAVLLLAQISLATLASYIPLVGHLDVVLQVILGLVLLCILYVNERQGRILPKNPHNSTSERLSLPSEASLRLSDPIIVLDSTWRTVWANDSAIQAFGGDQVNSFGREISTQFSDEANSRNSIRTSAERRAVSRNTFREVSLRDFDGKEIVFRVQVVKQHDVETGTENRLYILHDVTDHTLTRRRLTSVFGAMTEGILVHDLQGIIIDCNQRIEKILGTSRDQMIGRPVSAEFLNACFEDGSRWPSDDHPALVTLRTGIPIREAVMGMRLPSGGLKWVSVNTQVVKDSHDCVCGAISSYADVTSMREQLQRLDLTIANAGLGVWEWDLRSTRIRVNQIFITMLGYEVDEFEATRTFWESLIHDADRAAQTKSLESHLQGKSPDFRCEYRLRAKHGDWRSILVAGRIVERDLDQKPVRIAGVHIDVSSSKEMEHKLRESEQRMRLLFDTSLDAIVTVNSNGQVTDWNLQSELLFGWNRSEALGCDFQRMILPESSQKSDHQWLAAFAPEEVHNLLGKRREIQAVNRERQELTIEIAIAPLPAKDGIHFGVFMRDLSQSRALERQLAQAQRLESIGQLAAGVAHEINTPVQFVNDSVFFVREGMGDLFSLISDLQEIVKSAGEQDQQSLQARAEAAVRFSDCDYLIANIPKALDRSIEGLSRVAEIVRSMREFVHEDSPEFRPADLNRVINSTLTVARNEYKYVADVETNLRELPPVHCLAGEIGQVLLNLIVNATHAIEDRIGKSAERGRITISTSLDGDFAVIRISDTGTGIPENIRHRIFDPFFTTKDVGRGSGQGLSLAYRSIVDKHGGQITFDTVMGQGTTFTVRIPTNGRGVVGVIPSDYHELSE